MYFDNDALPAVRPIPTSCLQVQLLFSRPRWGAGPDPTRCDNCNRIEGIECVPVDHLRAGIQLCRSCAGLLEHWIGRLMTPGDPAPEKPGNNLQVAMELWRPVRGGDGCSCDNCGGRAEPSDELPIIGVRLCHDCRNALRRWLLELCRVKGCIRPGTHPVCCQLFLPAAGLALARYGAGPVESRLRDRGGVVWASRSRVRESVTIYQELPGTNLRVARASDFPLPEAAQTGSQP